MQVRYSVHVRYGTDVTLVICYTPCPVCVININTYDDGFLHPQMRETANKERDNRIKFTIIYCTAMID